MLSMIVAFSTEPIISNLRHFFLWGPTVKSLVSATRVCLEMTARCLDIDAYYNILYRRHVKRAAMTYRGIYRLSITLLT